MGEQAWCAGTDVETGAVACPRRGAASWAGAFEFALMVLCAATKGPRCGVVRSGSNFGQAGGLPHWWPGGDGCLIPVQYISRAQRNRSTESTMQKADGMMYAPKGKSEPVCQKGDFPIAAIGLDHGHIYGMCNGLVEAGAELKWVYDPDPARVEAFRKAYPEVQAASSKQQILDDESDPAGGGGGRSRETLRAGPRSHGPRQGLFHRQSADDDARAGRRRREPRSKETGRKYAVYYSERLHTECSIYAGKLIEDGAIGRVVQVIGTGPHRLNAPSRPDWFFEKPSTAASCATSAATRSSSSCTSPAPRTPPSSPAAVANYNNKQYPELEDFGDASLTADNGATNYFRVDWLTPDGLGAWGDGRAFLLGTDGYIELRKVHRHRPRDRKATSSTW